MKSETRCYPNKHDRIVEVVAGDKKAIFYIPRTPDQRDTKVMQKVFADFGVRMYTDPSKRLMLSIPGYRTKDGVVRNKIQEYAPYFTIKNIYLPKRN